MFLGISLVPHLVLSLECGWESAEHLAQGQRCSMMVGGDRVPRIRTDRNEARPHRWAESTAARCDAGPQMQGLQDRIRTE